MSFQVLDVLVRLVDNLRQLLAIDELLVDEHRHPLLELRQSGGIGAHDFRYGRTPARAQGLD